jgi:hypothetical protein
MVSPIFLGLLLLLQLAQNGGAQDCLTDPSNVNCTMYMYPDANSTADVSNLCMMMSYMPACSLTALCTDSHDHHGDPYCEPFSLLADGCASDMPSMGGCTNYVALCAPADSVVHQCDMYPPIPGLPTTAQANAAIISLCGQHYMPGCEKCSDTGGMYMDCDLLGVYSEICLSMPDMSDCAQWQEMCESIPDWSELCPSDASPDQPPLMRMYFHTGIVDYILFESWVPRTNGAYAGAVIGVMILAFLFEALQTLHSYLEFRWKSPEYQSGTKNGDVEPLNEKVVLVWGKTPFRFWIDLQRAAIHALEIVLGYFLMLIAMTFNVGLFCSLIAGFFLGHFVFGRLRAYSAKVSCCD